MAVSALQFIAYIAELSANIANQFSGNLQILLMYIEKTGYLRCCTEVLQRYCSFQRRSTVLCHAESTIPKKASDQKKIAV